MKDVRDQSGLGKVKPLVVAAIPAFNEERTIAKLVLEVQKFVDFVLVCDDGSEDSTAEIAERMGADVIKHEKNLGYGAALNTLFRVARELSADVLVTLDGDGQHDAREIPSLVGPVLGGEADIAVGSRFVERDDSEGMPFYRRFGVKVISRLVKSLAKNGVSDAQSGFRAYSAQALECLNFCEADMGASVEILLEAGKHDLRVCEVASTINYDNGDVATSTKHPLRQGVNVLLSILRYLVEERPLMILGPPGIIFLLAGVAFGGWMLQIYSVSNRIVTNVALAAIGFLFVGFFFLSTAVTLYAISRLSKKMNRSR